MKWTLATFILVSAITVSAQQKPLSARDYFDELKAANSFNHYSDTFVCFSDDNNPGFAIISRGTDVIEEMKRAGQTPSKIVMQGKDMLFVQTYFKGVANASIPYDPVVGSESTEWDIEYGKPFHGRTVYSINWKTGRYRMLVYALDSNKLTPAAEGSGKCEPIHADTKMTPLTPDQKQ